MKEDTTEIPQDFEVDILSLNKYEREAYHKNLVRENSKIPFYFNIVANINLNYPRNITYYNRYTDFFQRAYYLDTLNGNAKSSVGYGGAIEFGLARDGYLQFGYNYSKLKFEIESPGGSVAVFEPVINDIYFAFTLYASDVRFEFGDVFSISKNGFYANMFAGLGVNVWKGMTLSARYQVWGTGISPLESEPGYLKDFKESKGYAYISTIPDQEFKYQHYNLLQITLSFDLFFNAREEYRLSHRTAEYRAWKAVVGTAPVRPQNSIPQTPAVPKQESYSKYSDAELQKMLDDAVTKEQFDKAELIQKEIDKRSADKTVLDYTALTDEQLQTQLNDAIQKEDYDTAAKIQKEIKRRSAEKK